MSDGRGSIVTGGGGAIGLAIARRLGRDGPVAVVDISEESVEGGLRSLRDDGIEAIGRVVDVGVEAQAVPAFEELGRLLKPRVLVTAAGDVDYADPLEVSAERFVRMLSVHVLGTFLAARTLHPHLAAGDGRLVAIGSLAAHQGSPLHVHYAAAKAGIEGLVRSLAASWMRDGIRANVVVPGTIRTPIFERVPESVRAGYLVGGRTVGEPDDIADAVAYLASITSGRYLTGTAIHVDGGSRLALRPEA